jgi:hypothetical protein
LAYARAFGLAFASYTFGARVSAQSRKVIV